MTTLKIIISLSLIFTVSSNIAVGQEDKEFQICFAIDSATLSTGFTKTIDQIATLIKSPDFAYLKIFGYATTSGDEDYNMELSKKRALSVFSAINTITHIDESKVYVAWIGETLETYDFHYENAHPQSPCVDVLIQFMNKK